MKINARRKRIIFFKVPLFCVVCLHAEFPVTISLNEPKSDIIDIHRTMFKSVYIPPTTKDSEEPPNYFVCCFSFVFENLPRVNIYLAHKHVDKIPSEEPYPVDLESLKISPATDYLVFSSHGPDGNVIVFMHYINHF